MWSYLTKHMSFFSNEVFALSTKPPDKHFNDKYHTIMYCAFKESYEETNPFNEIVLSASGLNKQRIQCSGAVNRPMIRNLKLET